MCSIIDDIRVQGYAVGDAYKCNPLRCAHFVPCRDGLATVGVSDMVATLISVSMLGVFRYKVKMGVLLRRGVKKCLLINFQIIEIQPLYNTEKELLTRK